MLTKNEIESCQDCDRYSACERPCQNVRRYLNRGGVFRYPILNAKNSDLDNIFLFTTGIRETHHLFIAGKFDDPEVAEVYKADFIDNFNKIKRTKSRTPAWAWRHSKPVWVLYLHFERRLGIREIDRRIGLSHVRVLEIVNLHRRVLENHLDKVVRSGFKRSYFFERYFNQLTVPQVAEKYGISHQAVSKSIRRNKKKIKKSLQKSVASRQRVKREFLFSKFGKNIIFFACIIFFGMLSLTQALNHKLVDCIMEKKTLTNRELAKKLNIPIGKVRRNTKEFLGADPIATKRSGYAREISVNDGFFMYLGTSLVSRFGFSFDNARKAIAIIRPWILNNGFVPDRPKTLKRKGIYRKSENYIINLFYDQGKISEFFAIKGMISESEREKEDSEGLKYLEIKSFNVEIYLKNDSGKIENFYPWYLNDSGKWSFTDIAAEIPITLHLMDYIEKVSGMKEVSKFFKE